MAFIEEASYEEYLERKRREAQERANPPAPTWWQQSQQAAPAPSYEPSPMLTPPPQSPTIPMPPGPMPGAATVPSLWRPQDPAPTDDPLDRQRVLGALAKIRANAAAPTPAPDLWQRVGALNEGARQNVPGYAGAANRVGEGFEWWNRNVTEPYFGALTEMKQANEAARPPLPKPPLPWSPPEEYQGYRKAVEAQPGPLDNPLADVNAIRQDIEQGGGLGGAASKWSEIWRAEREKNPASALTMEILADPGNAIPVPIEKAVRGARALGRVAGPALRRAGEVVGEAALPKIKDAISSTVSGTPPEVGGAVLGGVIYQDDPNLSPAENLQRRLAYAAGGGLLGHGAKRLGMKSGLGGTVEDVGKAADKTPKLAPSEKALEDLNELLPQYQNVEDKVAALTDKINDLKIERQVLGEPTGVQRPPMAVGWTDAEIQEFARENYVNPFQNGWWEKLDPEAWVEWGPRAGGGKTGQSAQLAREIYALSEERKLAMGESATLRAKLDEAFRHSSPSSPSDVPGRSGIPELASETLRRAQGTAEQAAQLRPSKEGYAGNVKLDKFPDEVQPLIQQSVDQWNQFAGQRRGVITNEQAAQNAAAKALGTTIEDWLKTKPGRGFNQEEAMALGNTLAKTGTDYDAMLSKVAEARAAGTSTATMEAELADKALEYGALAAVRSGASAEAGRVLASFRQLMSGDFASSAGITREKAIQKAFDVLGGGGRFTDWVEEFSKIPADDVGRRYQKLQELFKASIWDKINAWRYASMLSSWKTHSVNIISNAGQSAVRPLTTALAGYPREAAADMYGMIQGVPEGIRAFGEAMKTGVSKFNVQQIENIRPRPLGTGRFGRAVALPSDLLAAADDLFKSINYSGVLHAEAYRLAKGNVARAEELLSAPTEAMVNAAIEGAKYATYQNDPAKLVTRMIALANTPGASGTVVRLFVPFIRTPANIYIRGLGMVLQPLIGPVKMAVKASKGDMRAMRMEGAKTLMAGSMLTGLWGMANSGQLTGQGPSDPAKRRILEESGWQANSIKVGDRWINYSNFGPVSIPMAFVAAVKEGLDEGKKPNHELAANVADRVFNSMMDVSFVRGLSDVLRGEGFSGRMAQTAASILGTAVPYGSALGAAERVIDPPMRAKDGSLQAVQGRIPIASQFLPEEPSIYGGVRQAGQGDTIAQSLLPWQSSAQRSDPVAVEVARLQQGGQSVSVRQFSDQYAGAKQAPEQRRLLQSEAGKVAATYVADTISRPAYQKLDDTQKAATLNRMLGTAYEIADLQLGNQLERDDRHKALLAWASVPQYEGVKGTPEEIRIGNYEIAQAKAKRTEYRRQYGDADVGDYKLMKEDKRAYQLAQTARLDSDYLKIKKNRVDQAFSGALSQIESQGLLGAGNTLLPIGGTR